MDATTQVIEALKLNVRLMVDSPELLRFEAVKVEGGAILRVTVPSAEFGRVVGKQGHNARALRTLSSAMGMAQKVRITLDIIES